MSSMSSENLDAEAILLLENGDDAMLWVGRSAPQELLPAFFNVNTVDAIKPSQFQLELHDNEQSCLLHAFLDEVNAYMYV